MTQTHDERLANRRDRARANADEINARRRAKYILIPISERRIISRRKNLLNGYGITVDQYQALFDAQAGVCAICGNPERFKNRKLMVDHDHQSGSIRGLLCGHCNLILGHAKDATSVLKSAISYLDGWGNESG